MVFKRIRQTLFAPVVVEDKFDAACFNLILFDIFFMPLFPWFSVSLSLPIMLYWYFRRGRFTKYEIEHKFFGIIVILMAISTMFSVFEFDGARYNTDFVTSFKRFMQYITSFMYFFFFQYFFALYRRSITNIIFWGIVYITIFALIYSFNLDAFINFKQLVCPFDPQVSRWNEGVLLMYRFNHMWADPNNVAYATVALSIFYFVEDSTSVIKKYILLICLAYVILCTMSFGGLGVASVLIGYLFLFTNIFRSDKTTILVGILFVVLIVLYILENLEYFTMLVDVGFAQRQEIYGNDGMADGGGRGADFINGLSKFNPLFLFVGSGKEGFVTEIGHICIWYMYGFPVYIYFLYVLFRKRRRQSLIEYLSTIPLFAGFTMNIAIGEQKYMLLTLLISAFYSAKYYNLNYQYSVS